MTRMLRTAGAALLLLALTAPAATAIVESDTGREYPDTVEQTCGIEPTTLMATGTGVREKTIFKVDVYTIVSYVAEGVDLGEDPASMLVALDEPKRLRMDLRRGFSREKLVDAFTGVIEKNYDDQSAFAADLAEFTGYFTRDAEEDDVLVFDYCPGKGLTTVLNGQEKGVIANPAFAEALWTVWFGREPADKGLRGKLLSVLGD